MEYDAAIRLGVHCGQQVSTADAFLDIAERCERLGLDWISNFDHFRPPDAGPDGPCLEATTLLAAAAARTSRIRCATLVLGAIYRNPAIVASIATTIDHISRGRLELGVGATAQDAAQAQYGIRVPPERVRMEILDETCQIMRLLWTRETTTFEGRHFRITNARLEPKPVQASLPLVIGGGGERRLLRIVAEHADVWNTVTAEPGELKRKLAVLADHCAETRRDPAEIRPSILFRAILAQSEHDAQLRLTELLPDGHRPPPFLYCGTPEGCVEHLRRLAAVGARDFLLNVRPLFDLTTIDLFAAQVAPALRAP